MGPWCSRMSAAALCRIAARACSGVRAHPFCAAAAAAYASSTSDVVHAWNRNAGAFALDGFTFSHVAPDPLTRQAPPTRNL